MSSIPQVSQAMQTILSTRATALERSTGFVQRCSVQLDGAKFAQPCVLTWMQKPDASYSQWRHTAASLGVHVSNQALEQRFGAASRQLMRALVEEGIQQVISSEARVPERLGRFNGVYLQDGTVLSLPAPLADQWPGSGGKGEQAALRIQARVELGSGSLSGLWLRRQPEPLSAVAQPEASRCLEAASWMPTWATSRSKTGVSAANRVSTGRGMPKRT